MGFLNRNSFETERIDLDGGYWVDIKNHLTITEANSARSLETRLTFVGEIDKLSKGTSKFETPDINSAVFQRVLASVVAWNFDDDAGNIVPCNTNNKSRYLPQLTEPEYEKIVNAVQYWKEKAEVSSADEASFPLDDQLDNSGL